jgi:phage terminase small subunit
MANGLEPRQRRFVEEYLIDLNATQAAIRAGYSAKTANQIGPRLLVNVGVQEAIQKRLAVVSEKAAFTSQEVLEELGALVRSNVRHFEMDDAGQLALADGAPEEAWRAVASVKRKTTEIPRKDAEPIVRHEVEYRMWDKNSAIDKAMRYLGLLNDNSAPPVAIQVIVRNESQRERVG